MNAGKFIAVFVVMRALVTIPAAAQAVPLDVEDVIATHSFSELTPVRFSPDGKLLAYSAKDNRKRVTISADAYARTGVPVQGIGADIFVVQVATGETTNLTEGKGNNWAPNWSPDGRYLAFFSDRDGGGQAKLWIAEIATEKLRKGSDAFVRADQVQWLPNNREVMLTVLPAKLTPDQFAERLTGNRLPEPSQPERKVPGSTVVIYRSTSNSSSMPKPQEGPWNLDAWLRDLVVVDLNSGKVKYIDSGHRIAATVLSPDASYVAVTTPKSFAKPGSQQMVFDLNVFSVRTGDSQNLASDVELPFGGSTFSWSPDSSALAYQAGGVETNRDCYVVHLKDRSLRRITNFGSSSRDERAISPLWDRGRSYIYLLHQDAIWKASPNGDNATQLVKIPQLHLREILAPPKSEFFSADRGHRLIVLTYDNESKRSGFYGVDVETGETAKLLEEDRWYGAFSPNSLVSVSSDGKLVAFFVEDAQHSQEIWLANSDFRNAQRLTHINPQLDKYEFGAARLIEWRSLDGEQLHGALLLPTAYVKGQTYPLIVCVYGGVSSSYSLVVFGLDCAATNMQLFATRGYAVLVPDAPQHLGTPMLDLAKTVLPGVNKVIDMGIADPTRLGVMGHSYGGYSVLSLLVETKRFKAAIAADGFSDLTAAYGEMNKNGSAFGQAIVESAQGLMGGTPWQFPQRFIENSPLYFLDRIETPLLIVHGAADATVLPFLSDETFVGLRRLGREATYAKYEREDHLPSYWGYANQVDYTSRVIDWFDKYLKVEGARLLGTDWPEIAEEKIDFCPKFVPRIRGNSPRLLGTIEKGKSQKNPCQLNTSTITRACRRDWGCASPTLSGPKAGSSVGVVECSLLAICAIGASGRIARPWRDRDLPRSSARS